jgi:hypothetical protein
MIPEWQSTVLLRSSHMLLDQADVAFDRVDPG